MAQRQKIATAPKRLDLERHLVEKAKIAFAKKNGRFRKGMSLEQISFREVMDAAVARFGPQIVRRLKAAGLRAVGDDVQKRQRPVTIETWEVLEEYAQEFGLARIQIVRAALELLTRSVD